MVAIVRPQAGAAGFVIRAKARKVGFSETGRPSVKILFSRLILKLVYFASVG